MGGEGCSRCRAALVGLNSDVAVGCLLVRLSGLVEALGTVLPPSLEQDVADQGDQEDDEEYDGYDVADVAGAHLGVVAVAQLCVRRYVGSGVRSPYSVFRGWHTLSSSAVNWNYYFNSPTLPEL